MVREKIRVPKRDLTLKTQPSVIYLLPPPVLSRLSFTFYPPSFPIVTVASDFALSKHLRLIVKFISPNNNKICSATVLTETSRKLSRGKTENLKTCFRNLRMSFHPLITFNIQGMYSDILVYNPGSLGLPQPIPVETTPTTVIPSDSKTINGPPLSAWNFKFYC